MKHEVKESSEGNVWKHIFTKDDAIYETVVYKYNTFEERTVICCSTQSGCKVGCSFCGTGKKFIRNLTADEIERQIYDVVTYHGIAHFMVKKFQIMFMSMGEPFHNNQEVCEAIEIIHECAPNVELLISTIGIPDIIGWSRFMALSTKIDKVGLQFSIHAHTDESRNKIIPFKSKMSLKEISDMGNLFFELTGRQTYLNYCVNGKNCGDEHEKALKELFNPEAFAMTFSVICSSKETMKDKSYRELDTIIEFSNKFLADGYNTRVFDPAGQDDIGGGCGQLWAVQKWMKENKSKVSH